MTFNLYSSKDFRLIFLPFLMVLLFSHCKKEEEQDLIKRYMGKYTAVRTSTSCCDSNWHLITTQTTVELEVKKSIKGIRIKGVERFDNFEVNAQDSTISAIKKNSEEYAKGKFFPNDSIFLYISIAAKVPHNVSYRMKRI